MDVIDAAKFAEENPNSRFRILNVPILAPGTCVLCKSDGGDGRQFIDLGMQVDFFGAVYFCTFCITEAAALLGLGRYTELAEEVNQLQNGCSERDIEIQELKEQVNAARTLLRNCHCDDNVLVSDGTVVDVEAIEDTGSDDSDSDEHGSVEESGDIPEASSDNESSPAKRTRRKAAVSDD